MSDFHAAAQSRRDARAAFDRREILRAGGLGLAGIALGSLFEREARAHSSEELGRHHAPRAKRVIQLSMAGAPSQFELFEDKPVLTKLDGQAPPASLIAGKRFAFIDPARARLLAPRRRFRRHGECGASVSELLPHTAGIVDRLCFLRSVQTNEINHGPAKLFMSTGFGQFGRPSLGAWVSYALGCEASNLPAYVVLQSGSRGPRGGAPLWGNGFLSPQFQGTPFRRGPNPVLHLQNPSGIDDAAQAAFFRTLAGMNALRAETSAEPELLARMRSAELAAAMQTSAPELADLGSESDGTKALYGLEDESPSFARNCLLARRMIERGVRFVQLYHADWDHHGDANNHLGAPLEARCREVDRASAALVLDLEQRGLLDDTLVIWGGEFGRTPMGEVRRFLGRDHHIDAFTIWMAGGGVKPGFSHGVTDEIGYAPQEGAVHVHDLHATLLHLLGLDHERLTHRFQGRDFRLTDERGRVVHEIIA